MLAVALLAMAAAAHAQTASSRAEKLEWPRTFSGQPDFAFTREEAITEARIRSARENEPMPLIPTLRQMLSDHSALDPLGLTKPVPVSTTVVSATAGVVSGTVAPRALTLLEKIMANAVALPEVSGTLSTDVAEFRSSLITTISSTIDNWHPSADRYNFDAVIDTLTLQAVVTSPVRYAVINRQRYRQGDTFQLKVPVQVPQLEIEHALQAQMPVSGTLVPQLYGEYQAVYNDVLTAFSSARSHDLSVGRQIITVPVTVRSIERRKVLLDVNGQAYELPIRFAY